VKSVETADYNLAAVENNRETGCQTRK